LQPRPEARQSTANTREGSWLQTQLLPECFWRIARSRGARSHDRFSPRIAYPCSAHQDRVSVSLLSSTEQLFYRNKRSYPESKAGQSLGQTGEPLIPSAGLGNKSKCGGGTSQIAADELCTGNIRDFVGELTRCGSTLKLFSLGDWQKPNTHILTGITSTLGALGAGQSAPTAPESGPRDHCGR
jgi:hypothetical protein